MLIKKLKNLVLPRSSSNVLHPLRLQDVPDFIRYKPNTKSKRISDATYGRHRIIIRRFTEYLESIGMDTNPRVVDIREYHYAGFHDWLATRGTRNTSVNSNRSVTKAIWNAMRKIYNVPVINPDPITDFLPEEKRAHAMSDEHAMRILQYASVRDSAMMLYLWGAGFRRQTVPRLRTDNTWIWQADDKTFRIASKIPKEKTSPPRLIMANNRAALAVQHWLNIREYQDSPWLFYDMSDGTQMSVNTVTSIFRKMRKRANIPNAVNVCAHSLRHKFAQDKLNIDNHDVAAVAAFMGITSETLLEVYAIRSNEDLAKKRFGDNDFPQDLVI